MGLFGNVVVFHAVGIRLSLDDLKPIRGFVQSPERGSGDSIPALRQMRRLSREAANTLDCSCFHAERLGFD